MIRRVALGLGFLAVLAGLGFGAHYWWQVGRFQQSTDDAYVESDISAISPRIDGYIQEVKVVDNQAVRKGDVLAVIDDRDFRARLDQARASLATDEAAVVTYDSQIAFQHSKIDQAQAQLDFAEAELERAKVTYDRRKKLVDGKIISVQEMDDASADYRKAKADVVNMRASLVAEQGQLAVIAPPNLVSELAAELGARTDHVLVVPYGVDLTRFDPQRVTPQRMIQMAQAWRLPDDRPIIMLPARYVPQKGHALLLEALTELKDIELRCLMVGPSQDGGAYRDQLEKLVKMMGLEDRVLLADECRDMPAALMLADLVVAPYLTPSTYNRVVIEAQALGRPLVVSDSPCARELVEGSSMAWLVPPNDAQALAWAIRDALALPSEERQARTQQVIENLQRRSDRDWMRHRVLGMYWDISGKPGAPF